MRTSWAIPAPMPLMEGKTGMKILVSLVETIIFPTLPPTGTIWTHTSPRMTTPTRTCPTWTGKISPTHKCTQDKCIWVRTVDRDSTSTVSRNQHKHSSQSWIPPALWMCKEVSPRILGVLTPWAVCLPPPSWQRSPCPLTAKPKGLRLASIRDWAETLKSGTAKCSSNPLSSSRNKTRLLTLKGINWGTVGAMLRLRPSRRNVRRRRKHILSLLNLSRISILFMKLMKQKCMLLLFKHNQLYT